ncbi:MAG TPA: S26 family signal peptidase [Candidatus Nitrosocosmicus sp.]
MNTLIAHKFVIITFLTIVITMISCESIQSISAITAQESHNVGYKEGCHKILTSTDRNNIDFIIRNNSSSEYQIYKNGFASGTLDLMDGKCFPDASLAKNASYVNEENPFYLIESGSMEPLLYKGSLIAANYSKNLYNSLKIGDVILFKALDPVEGNKTIVHRIIKIFQSGDLFDPDSFNNLCNPNMEMDTFSEKTIMTQGDANECSYPNVDIPITQKNYIGKAMFVIVQDSFIKHLISTINKLENLSQIIQNELNPLDINHKYDIGAIKHTNISLTEFASIINKFNNTDAVEKYANVKKSFVKAFNNRLESYNLQNNYLKTNNFDLLKRSSNFAYLSHKYMLNAYTLLLQSSSKTNIANN